MIFFSLVLQVTIFEINIFAYGYKNLPRVPSYIGRELSTLHIKGNIKV
jgi:hypothetical protein